MPLRGNNVIEFFRSPTVPLLKGEALALIPSADFCGHVDFSRPAAKCSQNQSGHLIAGGLASNVTGNLAYNLSLRLVLWGTLCEMNAGIYQVCHRRANHSVFRTTGVSLTLQDTVSTLRINDIEMGAGHRIAAPKVSTNRIFVATNSSGSTKRFYYRYKDPSDIILGMEWKKFANRNFVPLFGDRRTAYSPYGLWDLSAVILSIIPAMLDCEDATENPATGGPVQIQGQAHMPNAIYDGVMMGTSEKKTVPLR